jgi:hypothetical protein
MVEHPGTLSGGSPIATVAAMAGVEVDEVRRGKALVRFADVPQHLHGEDPRFAPQVAAWERYRTARRNPYLERAEAVLLLARRAGQPVGRIAAHVPEPGAEGRFGFWATADDAEVAGALVDAARAWLREQGCSTMVGPLSWEPGDEPGALVEGDGALGTTGRPWRPAWEAARLVAALGEVEVVAEERTWRLPAAAPPGAAAPEPSGPAPAQAGAYGDPRLVLGPVAAVPDLSGALRASRLSSAWGLARRVRERDWEGCTVVRCDGDPGERVPGLLAAAAAAGYRWVVSPWSPDPSAAPETVHRRYRAPV